MPSGNNLDACEDLIEMKGFDDQCKNRRHFILIEYPGIVRNVEKMIETLGGYRHLIQALNEGKKKLEVKYRPGIPHCKPVVGIRDVPVNSRQYVLKVTKVTLRRKGQSSSSERKVTYKAEICGPITATYKFDGFADYQYLPMECDASKADNEQYQFKSVIDDLAPMDCCLSKFQQLFTKEERSGSCQTLKSNQLLTTPQHFTIHSETGDYMYRSSKINQNKAQAQEKHDQDEIAGTSQKPATVVRDHCKDNRIISTRVRDVTYNIWVKYSDIAVNGVPMEPRPGALEALKKRQQSLEALQRIKELFNERPIWYRCRLLYELYKRGLVSATGPSTSAAGGTSAVVGVYKASIQVVSYHFITGPWRGCYVKFGYDPSKHPNTYKYQTLDVRRKKGLLLEDLQYVAGDAIGHSTTPREADTWKKERAASLVARREVCQYKRGDPPVGMIIYQLCDLLDEECQAVITSAGESLTHTCTEADGWLPPGTLRALRNIISEHHKQMGFVRKDQDDKETKVSKIYRKSQGTKCAAATVAATAKSNYSSNNNSDAYNDVREENDEKHQMDDNSIEENFNGAHSLTTDSLDDFTIAEDMAIDTDMAGIRDDTGVSDSLYEGGFGVPVFVDDDGTYSDISVEDGGDTAAGGDFSSEWVNELLLTNMGQSLSSGEILSEMFVEGEDNSDNAE